MPSWQQQQQQQQFGVLFVRLARSVRSAHSVRFNALNFWSELIIETNGLSHPMTCTLPYGNTILRYFSDLSWIIWYQITKKKTDNNYEKISKWPQTKLPDWLKTYEEKKKHQGSPLWKRFNMDSNLKEIS